LTETVSDGGEAQITMCLWQISSLQ